jgi:hypothetical protein
MSEPKDEPRRDESRRRALADEHRGEVIEDSGVPVEPRKLDQMVSVRLDPEVLRELRAIARSRNTTLSAVLRAAAVHYATYAHQVKELHWDVRGASTMREAQAWTESSVSRSELRLVSG